ncbi:MAG: hypothetical protein L0Z50_03370 [Verrucomicrobiales bacterium]|nr:hypothetical protein [Verrucomicrobiales bacterium]
MWGRHPVCRFGRHPAARKTGQDAPRTGRLEACPTFFKHVLRALWSARALVPLAAWNLPELAGQPVAAIRFAGRDAELAITEVSERTVRLELFPLDEQGRPRPATPSTILVPFPSTEKLRIRQLNGERELRVGALRVQVKPQPLTLSVRREDGMLVQELTFDGSGSTNAGIAFRTSAPVFGLGEGAQQFDRRGGFYPMEPTWGGWNRPVLGSVVPSPFLIGTEGWALFAHRPEGQFDLREGKGRFLPKAPGQEPLSRWDDSARRLTLEPDERMTKWPGGVRVFAVEAAGSDAEPKRIEFRGDPVVVNL